MKNKSRKKQTKKLIATSIIFIVLVSLIAGLLFFIKSNKNNNGNSDDIVINDIVKVIEINTPYCELELPGEWNDEIRVEQNDGEQYSIKIYGKIDGKGEVEIIEYIFNSEKGFVIGYFEKDEIEIPVSLVYYNTETDNSWTVEQIAKIQEYHGSIELSIIEQLRKCENFKMR